MYQSLSARRAWIEISEYRSNSICLWSLSARRAWIEITNTISDYLRANRSLSARRAWIEIRYVDPVAVYHKVALRKESVDRN